VTASGGDAGHYVGGIILEGGLEGNLATMLVIPPWIIQA
jgi:hypothetical protein